LLKMQPALLLQTGQKKKKTKTGFEVCLLAPRCFHNYCLI
jgi:hypothetical protein